MASKKELQAEIDRLKSTQQAQPQQINFPTQAELRQQAQARFEDIRKQQELDRQAAQAQAQQVFGEGSLGRVEEGRSGEIATTLGQSGQLATSGTQELQRLAAQRAQTVASGGEDPAFRQIAEAARRGQDIQTQTSLRQLRGELGAQGVRGGLNVQRQAQALSQANLAESQLQAQLAQARLSRVSEAQSAQEQLQQNILQQRGALQQQAANQLFAARAEEAGRADTNVQRALQERLGRLQLTEARAQQGTLERAAASQEVTAAAQLQAQLEQQNVANQIAFAESQKEPAKTEVHQSGGKVLCTELCRQGLISEEILEGDLIYAKRIPIETKVGYWVWAQPLARKCRTSKVLTYMSLPFVRAWATEMAYQVGKSEKGSLLGKIMTKTFEPACNILGTILIKLNIVDVERLAPEGTYTKQQGV